MQTKCEIRHHYWTNVKLLLGLKFIPDHKRNVYIQAIVKPSLLYYSRTCITLSDRFCLCQFSPKMSLHNSGASQS